MINLTKNSADFDTFRWVALAAADPKKDSRKHICGVYVDQIKGRVIATDGHRLHMAKITPESQVFFAKDGLYGIVKNNTKEMYLEIIPDTGPYPDIDRVLLSGAPDLNCPLTKKYPEWSFIKILTLINPDVGWEAIANKKDGAYVMSWHYIQDALACPGHLYYCNQEGGKLQLASEDGFSAVIMPMRV